MSEIRYPFRFDTPAGQHDAHVDACLSHYAPRRPVAGDWVSCHRYAPGMSMDRGGEQYLAQVIRVVDGEHPIGGCLVKPWRHTHLSFGEEFFAPWLCIVGRTAVTHYSLFGTA